MSNLAVNIDRGVKKGANNLKVSHKCLVIEVISLTEKTYLFEVLSPVDTVLDYCAGQHLQIDLDVNKDDQIHSLLYSIANSFDHKQPRRLQLIIENSSEYAGKIIQRLTEACEDQIKIDVTLAMGKAYLQTDLSLPHILVAAGSGVSKVKCIAEEILKQNPYADVQVYWSNKNIDDFYLLDQFNVLQEQHEHFEFTQILESPHETWSGRTGYIYEVVQQDFESLNDMQMYLCGSPQMVYGTIDQLEPLGLKEANCYSDVFEYAPRN